MKVSIIEVIEKYKTYITNSEEIDIVKFKQGYLFIYLGKKKTANIDCLWLSPDEGEWLEELIQFSMSGAETL